MRMTLLLVSISLSFPVFAQQAADAIAPEAASAQTSKQAGTPVVAENWMVAAANPLAVQAGAKVLKNGGSAADAMVAVQAVLGLVEPQSSGLGGGAFLVWYDADSGEVSTLDGRETAPMAATPRLFQDSQGEPLKFFDAVVGGLSVGTPGTLALMEEAHQRWGKADWAPLFDDAIKLADDGFTVSPRLADLVSSDVERLSRFPRTAAYFAPGGSPIAQGDILKNEAYADTLSRAKARRCFTAARLPKASSTQFRTRRAIRGCWRCETSRTTKSNNALPSARIIEAMMSVAWGRPPPARLPLARYWACWTKLICLQWARKIQKHGG